MMCIASLACALLPAEVTARDIDDVHPVFARALDQHQPSVEDDHPPAITLDITGFAEPEPFGRRRTRRWQVLGGYAFEPVRLSNQIGLAGLGVSYFIVDNLSLDAELNGLFVHQRRDDAIGGNLNLLFRWHAIVEESWSMYFEGGAGILLTSRRVPHDGSRFNFTPQLGGGFSFDLGHDVRLMTGLRWHHISNANLYADNPGRDSALFHIGVSFGY